MIYKIFVVIANFPLLYSRVEKDSILMKNTERRKNQLFYHRFSSKKVIFFIF